MKRLLTHTMTGITLSMLTYVTFAQESNTMVTPAHLANVTQSSFSTQPFENNVLNAGSYTMEQASCLC